MRIRAKIAAAFVAITALTATSVTSVGADRALAQDTGSIDLGSSNSSSELFPGSSSEPPGPTEPPEEPIEVDPPAPGEVVANPKARNATPEEIDSIFGDTSVDENGPLGEVSVPNSIVDASGLEPGVVLSVPPSELFPKGEIIKIQEVQPSDGDSNRSTVTAVAGDLNDVIAATGGEVELEQASSTVEWKTAEGVQDTTPPSARNRSIEIEIQEEKGFSTRLDYKLPSGAEGDEESGDFDLAASVGVEGKIKATGLVSVNRPFARPIDYLKVEQTSEARVEFEATANLEIHEELEKDIGNYTAHTSFMVGPVLIWLILDSELEASATLDVSASGKYGTDYTVGRTIGIEVRDGDLRPIDKSWHRSGPHDDNGLSGQFELLADLEASVDVSLYTFVGIEGSMVIWGSLEASISLQEDLACYGAVGVRGVVNAYVRMLALIDEELPIFDEGIELYRSDDFCESEPGGGDQPPGDTGDDPGDGGGQDEPPSDPPAVNGVVIDPVLRSIINISALGRHDTPDEAISREDMQRVEQLTIYDGGDISTYEGMEYATNLESLGIESFEASTLPDFFGSLTSLRSLSLEIPYVTSIPSSIAHSDKLEYLRILGSPWWYYETLPELSIPEEVAQIGSLKTLVISRNGEVGIPDCSDCWSALVELNIGLLNRDLPSSLFSSQDLWRVDLVGLPNLAGLPDSLFNAPGVENLNLSDIPSMVALPDSMGAMDSLTNLTIDNVGIRSLPSDIGEVDSLRFLTLREVSIVDFPESLKGGSNFDTLTLSAMGYSSFPEAVCELRSVERLFFKDESFDRLSPCLLDMQNLLRLRLDGTGVDWLDPVAVSLREKGVEVNML